MVKNATDSLPSAQSMVTVRLKPANATVTPAAKTILVGDTVTFTVNVAVGTAPFTYQWRQNQVNINGATGTTYHIASAIQANSGTYAVTVTNAAGSHHVERRSSHGEHAHQGLVHDERLHCQGASHDLIQFKPVHRAVYKENMGFRGRHG